MNVRRLAAAMPLPHQSQNHRAFFFAIENTFAVQFQRLKEQ
jgi:hypothetical protein